MNNVAFVHISMRASEKKLIHTTKFAILKSEITVKLRYNKRAFRADFISVKFTILYGFFLPIVTRLSSFIGIIFLYM